MFCSNCGNEVLSGKFCPKCGSPLTAPVPVAEEEATVGVNGGIQEEPTDIAYEDATVAASVSEVAEAEQSIAALPEMPLDPKAAKKAAKAAKKANKKPMRTKKKVLVAISSILAFVIVLGSVAVGVVAFTPKYKFMLALYNTVRMQSFDLKMMIESYDFVEFDEDEGGYLWDYQGKDWKFESGSYSETTLAEYKTSYNLGESDEDTEFYTVTEETHKLTGSGYGKELNSEGYAESIRINEEKFSANYAIHSGGEMIMGSLSGEDGFANIGSFYGGKTAAYYEYLKKNNKDYKSSVENGRFSIEFFLSLIQSSSDAKELEFDEWTKIIYDLVSLMLKEGAIEIVDTRIEDGMTKYDIRIDFYLFDKCRLDYAKENDNYKAYLKSKETYGGSNEFIDLKGIRKSDYSDEKPIEFTLGTKGMRFVYGFVDEGDYDGNNKSSLTMEVTITNINKKKDYSGQFSDIKAIADGWKDKYTYCETAADFKAYFEKDAEE